MYKYTEIYVPILLLPTSDYKVRGRATQRRIKHNNNNSNDDNDNSIAHASVENFLSKKNKQKQHLFGENFLMFCECGPKISRF